MLPARRVAILPCVLVEFLNLNFPVQEQLKQPSISHLVLVAQSIPLARTFQKAAAQFNRREHDLVARVLCCGKQFERWLFTLV